MLLEKELEFLNLDVTSTQLEETIADIWNNVNRGLTADGFLCRPWHHQEFCSMVRYRLNLPETCDNLILRTLLNKRKRGDFGPVERAGTQTLRKELAGYGIDTEAETFREKIDQLFLDVHPTCAVDHLLMQWRDARHFCALVCGALKLHKSLAVEELILRTLLNERRRGKLSLRDRESAA